MRKLLSLLAMMTVLLPLSIINVIASPPDSCLKMALPNDYRQEWVADLNRYDWVGSINDDSVRIDSCSDSPTFGEQYGKRYFVLKFNVYPFDTLLKISELVGVEKIPNKIPALKEDLLRLQQTIGTIYLTKQPNKYWQSDEYLFNNGWIALLFENYQNIDSVLNMFKTEIHDVEIVGFEATVKTPTGGGSIISSFRKELEVYPNPSDQLLTLQIGYVIGFQNIEIYNSNGIKVKEIPYSETINISDLPKGVYFIKYANENINFVKQ